MNPTRTVLISLFAIAFVAVPAAAENHSDACIELEELEEEMRVAMEEDVSTDEIRDMRERYQALHEECNDVVEQEAQHHHDEQPTLMAEVRQNDYSLEGMDLEQEELEQIRDNLLEEAERMDMERLTRTYSEECAEDAIEKADYHMEQVREADSQSELSDAMYEANQEMNELMERCEEERAGEYDRPQPEPVPEPDVVHERQEDGEVVREARPEPRERTQDLETDIEARLDDMEQIIREQQREINRLENQVNSLENRVDALQRTSEEPDVEPEPVPEPEPLPDLETTGPEEDASGADRSAAPEDTEASEEVEERQETEAEQETQRDTDDRDQEATDNQADEQVDEIEEELEDELGEELDETSEAATESLVRRAAQALLN